MYFQEYIWVMTVTDNDGKFFQLLIAIIDIIINHQFNIYKFNIYKPLQRRTQNPIKRL